MALNHPLDDHDRRMSAGIVGNISYLTMSQHNRLHTSELATLEEARKVLLNLVDRIDGAA